MSNCLVIGGSGFLGSSIARELNRVGHTVVTLDPVTPTLEIGTHILQSICAPDWNPEMVSEFDTVFLFSGILGTAEIFDDPLPAIDTNLRAPVNMLSSIRKRAKKPRFILPTQDYTWNNLYTMTSQALEKSALAYSDNFNIPANIVQIANAYGPRQAKYPVRKIAPHFITRALANQSIEVFGSGQQKIRLSFSEDVASALVKIADNPVSNRQLFFDYNVEMSVLEFAHLIIEMTGSTSEIAFVNDRAGEGGSQTGWYSDKISEVAPVEVTDLKQGLRRTIDYYRSQIH